MFEVTFAQRGLSVPCFFFGITFQYKGGLSPAEYLFKIIIRALDLSNVYVFCSASVFVDFENKFPRFEIWKV